MTVLSIGKTTHGKWSYLTVVEYSSKQVKDGSFRYVKGDVLVEATTYTKIKRLALELSESMGVPLVEHVRHNDYVQPVVG